jgi:DNA polymerase-3 subunit alpha
VKDSFVHLHTHTYYSLLDGMISPEDLLSRTEELGMDSIAVTDHGNTFGLIEFYRHASQKGIKPILGCEVYLSPLSKGMKTKAALEQIYHLVLIAESDQGLRNILKLVTIGHLEGFYRKPRIDFSDLEKHHKGIIGLSACLHGLIPRLLLAGRREEAVKRSGELSEIFGKDYFFMELMDHGVEQQRKVLPLLVTLAHKNGIPLVATNDVHYLREEDHRIHEVLLCIQTATGLDDPERISYPSDQMYLKGPREMRRLFREVEEAVDTTMEIASRCHATIDFDHLHLPGIALEEGMTSGKKLTAECEEGLRKRGLAGSRTARERMEYESRVIREKGLSDYFLIVQDLVRFARSKDIPVGSGRGSAAGSLVAYLLGITDIDPLRFGLYFERFLNPEREGMPDIDIDFGHRGRDSVFEYVSSKYGIDNVAHIATLDTLSPRSAVRDVGRALNLPYGYVDMIAKKIPFHLWEKPLRNIVASQPELQKLYEEEETVKDLIDTASRLQGLPRHPSIHAAGVVIADAPLTNYVSLQYTSKSEVITQATMEPVEAIGLLKIDLLGLRFLSVIQDTVRLISSRRGIDVSSDGIDLDDDDTYGLLSRGDTAGLFQLESTGMTRLLVKLKPERIEDLCALLSLYRPGPLGGGVVDSFIRRRHGDEEITCPHDVLKAVLKDTCGIILYQEQVMQVAREFAGYTLGQADILRRAMSKKLIGELKGERQRFVRRAEAKGRNRKTAEEIFELLSHFGGYGFNKAHSMGYAIEVYRTAYLKAHFLPEYWVSLLNCNPGFTSALTRWLSYARRHGFDVRAPDINLSKRGFTLEEDGILRAGFSLIKYLGAAGIEGIVNERSRNGAFVSFMDFLRRIPVETVNRRAIESLIKSGCFNFTRSKRHELLSVMDEAIRQAQKSRKRGDHTQITFFAEQAMNIHDSIDPPRLPDLSTKQLLEMEFESLDMYFSAHPMDPYEDVLRKNNARDIAELSSCVPDRRYLTAGIVTDVRVVRTKKNTRMAFCRLEDKTGAMEMILFPKLFADAAVIDIIEHKRPSLVLGTLEVDERGVTFLAEEITAL